MAYTPTSITIPLTGKVIIRLDNGAEIIIGDIVYNADVELQIGLAPEKFHFVSNRTPAQRGIHIE